VDERTTGINLNYTIPHSLSGSRKPEEQGGSAQDIS